KNVHGGESHPGIRRQSREDDNRVKRIRLHEFPAFLKQWSVTKRQETNVRMRAMKLAGYLHEQLGSLLLAKPNDGSHDQRVLGNAKTPTARNPCIGRVIREIEAVMHNPEPLSREVQPTGIVARAGLAVVE